MNKQGRAVDPNTANRVSITKRAIEGQVCIRSSNPFFNTEKVILKQEDDRLIVRKPDIFYTGKMHTPSKLGKSKQHQMTLVMPLPIGAFEIDQEESDIDQLVIYTN